MKKNNLITLIITLLIIGVIWWYINDRQVKNKKTYIEDLYSFGSLNVLTEDASLGCTDPEAENYNAEATLDSGDCIYKFGCCDVEASNYDPEADSCHVPNNNSLCQYGQSGGGITFISGCTNSNANNYDPNAVTDDGSCMCPCLPSTHADCNGFWERLFNSACCVSDTLTYNVSC